MAGLDMKRWQRQKILDAIEATSKSILRGTAGPDARGTLEALEFDLTKIPAPEPVIYERPSSYNLPTNARPSLAIKSLC